jgi:D-arabinose 1-dehydrogenase-like Zn-dependent alcohol dehydrogenase
MLDFCAKNNIPSDIELIPIQKVNEAYPRTNVSFILERKQGCSQDF